MATAVEMLQQVAVALGPLRDEVVFVGGTIPALLITDPAAPPIRPTRDVDLVVDARNHPGYARFEARLRAQGFQIKSPPVCRYGIGDILVDVMTTTPGAMGFSERWYAQAFATAQRVPLPDGAAIRIIRAPLFLATKLSAWADRGRGDYYAQDIEDIIAVIDGRETLLDEIRKSRGDLRRFLADRFEALLEAGGFLDAVAGHLGGNAIAHQRAGMAIDVMRQIVKAANA